MTNRDVRMNLKNKTTIGRILKVNHAGEYGAIRIYGAQIALSKVLYPDIVGLLRHMYEDEVNHCRLFYEAMPSRQAHPCRALFLWWTGGFFLGLMTALMGRSSIWICTAAVEETVHRHLEEQLHFLKDKDPELYQIILSIQEEELDHLNEAKARIFKDTTFSKILTWIIASTTEFLIWCSTYGESSKMSYEIKRSV